MGCGPSRSSHEQLITSFWQYLPIRKLKPNEFTDYILQVKKVDDNKETIHDRLLSKHLTYEENKEISDSLFKAAFLKYKDDFFSHYLLALLILTVYSDDKSPEAFDTIIKHFPINIEGALVHRDDMFKIIEIYISLTTSFGIDYIKEMSSDKSDFVFKLTKGYNLEIQRLMIEERFLGHIRSERIPLNKFYSYDYAYFSYDDLIRDKIFRLSIQKNSIIDDKRNSMKLHRDTISKINTKDDKVGN